VSTVPCFPTLRTDIAGLAVADLARQFGTPTFVYDSAMIRRRLADLAAFDHARYAQKACSNLAVLALLRRAGALVDAVSGNEIRRALAAGYAAAGSPPPIVYTADIFDADALDLCIAALPAAQARARSRCASIPASATATAARRTPVATSRSTASGTSRLPSAWPWPRAAA
jgi:hypothetical protein